MVAVVASLLLVVEGSAPDTAASHERYKRGAMLVQQGRGPEARSELQEARETTLDSTFPEKPPSLSARDLARLQREILSRCHLGRNTDTALAPWYFHYELALELAHRRDRQRALDAFLEAARRRRDPQRNARMYGMWFIDYTPYFQIARAHALLGNWHCARDVLALSRRLREIKESDTEFTEFVALAKEVEEHANDY